MALTYGFFERMEWRQRNGLPRRLSCHCGMVLAAIQSVFPNHQDGVDH